MTEAYYVCRRCQLFALAPRWELKQSRDRLHGRNYALPVETIP